MAKTTSKKPKAPAPKRAADLALWEKRARDLIRGEITKRGLTRDELIARLANIGIKETRQNLSNKIQRGRYSAVFLFQIAHALEMKTIHLWWEE